MHPNDDLLEGRRCQVKAGEVPVEISTETKTAKHIAGPIAAPDGSIDVTVFGSALTSGGMLYL